MKTASCAASLHSFASRVALFFKARIRCVGWLTHVEMYRDVNQAQTNRCSQRNAHHTQREPGSTFRKIATQRASHPV